MWVSAGAQVDGKHLVRDTDGSIWLCSEDAGLIDGQGGEGVAGGQGQVEGPTGRPGATGPTLSSR